MVDNFLLVFNKHLEDILKKKTINEILVKLLCTLSKYVIPYITFRKRMNGLAFSIKIIYNNF